MGKVDLQAKKTDEPGSVGSNSSSDMEMQRCLKAEFAEVFRVHRCLRFRPPSHAMTRCG